jgi:hypothetical protein
MTKEAVVAYFKVLSCNFPGGTEKNIKMSIRIMASGMRFKHRT